MTELNELHRDEELEQAFEKSLQKPVILFKHSTTCPISARAFNEFTTFLEETDKDVDSYLVKVIENRSVSNQIENITKLRHESPQIFLLKDKVVKWNTSHSKITVESIEEAIENMEA